MGYLEEICSRITLIKRDLCNDNNSEYARRVGEKESKVRSYTREGGKLSMPSAEFIAKTTTKFDINPEWILFGKGELKKEKDKHAIATDYSSKTIYEQTLLIKELYARIEQQERVIKNLNRDLDEKNATAAGA